MLDPKGELFEATSQRRSRLGPVYWIAPLDEGSGKPVHRFDPVSRVRREADARSIAQQMFPRDPKSPSFFAEDAVGFMTAVIMFVRYKAPPHRRTLATVCQMASLKGVNLLKIAREMEAFPPSADAARAILEKDAQRGLKVLQETLSSKLYEWKDQDIQRSVSGNDVSFESLKDRPATVYIEIPFASGSATFLPPIISVDRSSTALTLDLFLILVIVPLALDLAAAATVFFFVGSALVAGFIIGSRRNASAHGRFRPSKDRPLHSRREPRTPCRRRQLWP